MFIETHRNGGNFSFFFLNILSKNYSCVLYIGNPSSLSNCKDSCPFITCSVIKLKKKVRISNAIQVGVTYSKDIII